MSAEFTGYIHDGCTMNAYIQAVPRMYPEVRFTYRPMTSRERLAISGQVGRMDDYSADSFLCKAATEKILWWSLRDHQGNPLPVSGASMERIQPNLSTRIYSIIQGSEPSDEDPLLTGPDKEKVVEQLYRDVVQEGAATPGEQEAARLKNS